MIEPKLPEYSNSMYLKGFTAMQVYSAFKQTQRKKHKDKKKKKRKENLMEKEIFNLIEAMADAAISEALDDIFNARK